MFLFKKIVAPLIFPLPLTFILLTLGLVFLWVSKKQRTGKILVTIGVIFLLLMSTETVSHMLLQPLEEAYSPIKHVSEDSQSATPRFIVVLGGGHYSDNRLPLTGQIGRATLVRLVEGIRIQRLIPGSKLVLSGGAVFDPIPDAEIMAGVARQLGVSNQDIVLETESKDTKDEAHLLKDVVNDHPFILVTSASHMARSIALFRKLGMNPIPAPTGHIVHKKRNRSFRDLYPTPGNLHRSTRAVYEYLGLAWAKLRGQI